MHRQHRLAQPEDLFGAEQGQCPCDQVAAVAAGQQFALGRGVGVAQLQAQQEAQA